MAIIRVEPSLKIISSDGTEVVVSLNAIPQAGCEATARWLAGQLKPDPANPDGPPISLYATSASSTPLEILRNLANSILLGKVAEYAEICPSPAVQAKTAEVRAAFAELEQLKKIEAGLIVET